MTEKIIQEIIDDLKLIPNKITTEINIKELTVLISRELQKQSNRSFS